MKNVVDVAVWKEWAVSEASSCRMTLVRGMPATVKGEQKKKHVAQFFICNEIEFKGFVCNSL